MTEVEPLEDLYFNWLCSKVQFVEVPTPSLTYWKLFRRLHGTCFVHVVLGDDNRASEGVELRREFIYQTRLEADEMWFEFPCSVFEMLIALARRCEFYTTLDASVWFWTFMTNLSLDNFSDAVGYDSSVELEIHHILEVFMWRMYDVDGQGGLFPLREPRVDQSEQELWYQFCSYLVDQQIS